VDGNYGEIKIKQSHTAFRILLVTPPFFFITVERNYAKLSVSHQTPKLTIVACSGFIAVDVVTR
jgi:hypothetical protein